MKSIFLILNSLRSSGTVRFIARYLDVSGRIIRSVNIEEAGAPVLGRQAHSLAYSHGEWKVEAKHFASEFYKTGQIN